MPLLRQVRLKMSRMSRILSEKLNLSTFTQRISTLFHTIFFFTVATYLNIAIPYLIGMGQDSKFCSQSYA